MRRYTMKISDEALKVAFEAGALDICRTHRHVFIRTHDGGAEQNAHAIAARMIGHDQADRADLIDALTDVIEMGVDECPHCAAPAASLRDAPQLKVGKPSNVSVAAVCSAQAACKFRQCLPLNTPDVARLIGAQCSGDCCAESADMPSDGLGIAA